MTKDRFIPEELDKYVWFAGPGKLVHDDDMPKELEDLFEETRKKVLYMENQRKEELKNSIKNNK